MPLGTQQLLDDSSAHRCSLFFVPSQNRFRWGWRYALRAIVFFYLNGGGNKGCYRKSSKLSIASFGKALDQKFPKKNAFRGIDKKNLPVLGKK